MHVLQFGDYKSLYESEDFVELNEGVFDFLKKNKSKDIKATTVKDMQKVTELIGQKLKNPSDKTEEEINNILDGAMKSVQNGTFKEFKKKNKAGLAKVRFYFQKFGKPMGVGVVFGFIPILFLIWFYAGLFGNKKVTGQIDKYLKNLKAAAEEAGIDPHSADIIKIDGLKDIEDDIMNGESIRDIMDNENIDIEDEDLNESILVTAYIMIVVGMVMSGLLAALVSNLDKKIKIKKLVNKETDPEKKAELKAELQELNKVEVNIRKKISDLKDKNKEKAEEIKKTASPEDVEKAKIQIAKYNGKIKGLEKKYNEINKE